MQKKAEIAAELRRVSRERDVLAYALHILGGKHKPDHVEEVREGECRYVYRGYKLAAVHGGILLLEFRCPGQSPHWTAYYLDDFAANVWGNEHSVAITRIVYRRGELLA